MEHVQQIRDDICGMLDAVLSCMPKEQMHDRSPASAIKRTREEIAAERLPGLLKTRLEKLENMQPMTRQAAFGAEATEAMNQACAGASQRKSELWAGPDMLLPAEALEPSSAPCWEGLPVLEIPAPYSDKLFIAAEQMITDFFCSRLSDTLFDSVHLGRVDDPEVIPLQPTPRMMAQMRELATGPVLLIDGGACLLPGNVFAKDWWDRTGDWIVAWGRPLSWIVWYGEGTIEIGRRKVAE